MKLTTRHLAIISLVFAIIAIQASCQHSSANIPATEPTTQPTTIVRIDNFEFQPKDLEIPVGTTVTWKNADDVPHTATTKDEPQTFDSGPLDTDDKFSYTFTKPGKFPYYCKVHPHMTGTITVK